MAFHLPEEHPAQEEAALAEAVAAWDDGRRHLEHGIEGRHRLLLALELLEAGRAVRARLVSQRCGNRNDSGAYHEVPAVRARSSAPHHCDNH
jgi:hypothetical protein